MTAIKDAVVLVTGGNRGIGKALVDELFRRGAAKVYATARDPRTITHPDAIPLRLDVNDEASVAAAAEQAPDVTVVINNAGVATGATFLDSPLDEIRLVMDTNFYGPLLVARAFVPVIERNGGGHLLNVHSVRSWVAEGRLYSASKAALWSQTNSLRLLLLNRGIKVTGLHVSYVDTDMTAKIDAPKSAAPDVAAAAVDGIEANATEVLADDETRQVKATLADDVAAMYPQLAT
jgi:NAD(P)-dependent dehydrogenase (short-subunit alcohol dehydrogenase family)